MRQGRRGRHGQCTHCHTEDTCLGTAARPPAACTMLFVPPVPVHRVTNVGALGWALAHRAQTCTMRTHLRTCECPSTDACADRHARSLCLAARASPPPTPMQSRPRQARCANTQTETHTETHAGTCDRRIRGDTGACCRGCSSRGLSSRGLVQRLLQFQQIRLRGARRRDRGERVR